MQAIIFLAPLAFNLTLEEDPKVNRLVRALPISPSFLLSARRLTSWAVQEDSITLWREVCTNALLAKTTLILFLNKVSRFSSRISFTVTVTGAWSSVDSCVQRCAGATAVASAIASPLALLRSRPETGKGVDEGGRGSCSRSA